MLYQTHNHMVDRHNGGLHDADRGMLSGWAEVGHVQETGSAINSDQTLKPSFLAKGTLSTVEQKQSEQHKFLAV